MFTLSQKYAIERHILNCDYVRYAQPSLNLVNAQNIQAFIDIPRENSDLSLKDSYLELDFIVSHLANGHSRYANGDRICLVNLSPNALF